MRRSNRRNDPGSPEWRRRIGPAGVEHLRRYDRALWALLICTGVYFVLLVPAGVFGFSQLMIAPGVIALLCCFFLMIRHRNFIADEVARRLGIPRKLARGGIILSSPEQFDESIVKMQAKMRKRGIPARPAGGDSDGSAASSGHRPPLVTTGSSPAMLPPAIVALTSLLVSGGCLFLAGAPGVGGQGRFVVLVVAGVFGLNALVMAVYGLVCSYIIPGQPIIRNSVMSNDPVGPDWQRRLGEEGATYLRHYRTVMWAGPVVAVAYLAGFTILLVTPGFYRPAAALVLIIACTVVLAVLYGIAYNNLRIIAARVAEQIRVPVAVVRRSLDFTHPARYDASLAKINPDR